MPLLTDASVRKYAPTNQRREIPDTRAPCLRLIIQPKPSGAKSWAMRFRRPDGRTAKLTLGAVDLSEEENAEEPVLGGALTLRAARQLANKIDRDRARGIDVVGEYKTRKSRKQIEAKDAAAKTFGSAVVEFLRDHKVKRWGTRPRRWRDDAAILGLRWPKGCEDLAKVQPTIIKGGLADTWSDKPLAGIDGHDIHSVVDQARKLGIPGLERRNREVSENRGRKVHSGLGNFFRWAQRQRKVSVNPVQGVWNPGAPPARDRTLNDAEIKSFWLATAKVAEPVRSSLRILLLTGQRVNEVIGTRREELAPDGIWVIPGARTKNHRPHSLVLPPLVREIITGVPRVESSPYVFTGATGKTPITVGSKVKRAIDEAIGNDVPPWRLHDLRRSAASGMQRLSIRPEVIERLLNHVSGTFAGVAGVYQRDPLAEEVAAALLRWSQHVTGLVEGGDTVINLRKEKK
jgi:integrase